MEQSVVDRIRGWDRQEVADGQTGLSRLGDAEFSGAVDTGGGWVFILNGRIVGTTDESVDDAGAVGPLTAYTAPHPSLPLLFAMQERGGEPQGRYFTDDTALTEVHDTLSSGSFTGYIELSEKVHSGDYYVVYYGGRALFVAFVGTSERLVTGEEAFDRAGDEVGIYEINPVDLEVRDPPDPAPSTGDGSEAAEGTTEDLTERSNDPDPGVARGQTDDSEPPDDKAETGIEMTEEPAGEPRDSDPDAVRDQIEGDVSSEEETPERGGADAEPEGQANAGELHAESGEGGRMDSGPTETTEDTHSRNQGSSAGVEGPSRRDDEGRQVKKAGGLLRPDRDGVAWDDGQTIPALDPERTAVPADDAGARARRNRRSNPGLRDDGSDPAPADGESTPGSIGRNPDPVSGTGVPGSGTRDTEQAGDVSADRVAELEAKIEKLQNRVDSLNAEQDQPATEHDRGSEEHAEVESAGEFVAEQADAEERLTRREALAEADVLVRYDSKGRPTLADAHEGDVSLEAVGENRQLKIHTQFDADAVTVDGEPFESFLRDTLAYRFVTWLTGEFLFEIRNSGNETALRDLYDAIPEIDRAEFDETVAHGDGDDESGMVFDIVFRNETGEPLFLVDIDEGRDPTRGRLMSELLDRSRYVAEAEKSVAGVCLITSSFFDSEVHEAVREATKSWFLDRDLRASFVKLSRNTGYHACLIEARNNGFHLSRPDL